MNSSRRGFLGLLGGGALAGPKAVKQAFAKAGAGGLANVSGAGLGQAVSASSSQSWLAHDVLRLLRGSQRMPPQSQFHDRIDPNVEALVSVSKVNKHRMNVEAERERELENSIRSLVQHYKLDWIGLSEEQLIAQIERIAGDQV